MTDFEKERTAAEKLAEANHAIPGPADSAAAAPEDAQPAASEAQAENVSSEAPEAPSAGEEPSTDNVPVPAGETEPAPASSGGAGGEPPAKTDDADDGDGEDEDGEDEDGDGEDEDGEGGKMSLMDHLRELRRRLCYCVAAAFVGFCVCMFFVEPIFNVLTKPLIAALPPGSTAMYTTLPEAFFTRMYIAFMTGLFLVSPLIFYEIWAFISPGLYDEEKRFIIPVALISAIFFVGGGLFCYYIVFHYAFQFFMSFATEQIVAAPKISDYLDFVMKLLLAFGLIFEMPIFTFFLARMGAVTAQRMRSVRRYAILVIFIVAAILTPPDVVSQLLMAVPMLLLYEISILVAVVFGKKKAVPAEGEDESADDGEDSMRSAQEEDYDTESSVALPEKTSEAEPSEKDAEASGSESAQQPSAESESAEGAGQDTASESADAEKPAAQGGDSAKNA